MQTGFETNMPPPRHLMRIVVSSLTFISAKLTNYVEHYRIKPMNSNARKLKRTVSQQREVMLHAPLQLLNPTSGVFEKMRRHLVEI